MSNNPTCPKCSAEMKPTQYGMVFLTPEQEKETYVMGCGMETPMAEWGCKECNYLSYPEVEPDSQAPHEILRRALEDLDRE